MKMKKMLQEDTYDHVFVHLGSNDVLLMCSTDRRKCTRTTPEKIKKYKRWIRTANDLLKEVSSHIPYVYYHPYSIDPVRHLSIDGLHLNDDGGRFCFRTIQDNVFGNYPVRADISADVSLDIMQWPALHNNVSGIVSEIASVQRKTYASIVKEIAKKRYRRVRYLRRSSRCAKKLGKMNNEYLVDSILDTCGTYLLTTEDRHNTSRMLLLLSNDVEQNPGPTYSCKWIACTTEFTSIGQLDHHLIQHVSKDQECKWIDCCVRIEDNWSLEIHVLQHLYSNVDLFSTLNNWTKHLPSGSINDEYTNLHLCPIHLRSKLMLPLFDEDFMIPARNYSVNDHMSYLERLCIKDNFNTLIKDFFS
ncbi:hypothetical protein ACF0H5_001154 [Mactra antiquata]